MDNNITLPTTFTYSIPGMDIAPGPFVFTYVSEFLSLITPEELPFDLVRDALYSNLTLIEFTTNAMKIESGFIALMSFFVVMSLIPLGATCAWCCNRKTPGQDEDGRAPVIILDNSKEDTLNCRRRASMVTLLFFFIILALSDFCIFYANSRLATTIEMTPEMIQSTVHDFEMFLKDTHLQIKRKLDNGFNIAIEKVIKDLEDVDILLGEPIQTEISSSTGIELAYDSLTGISNANAELINRVLMLQETVARAMKISQEASSRMEELQIQLSVLQRQCTYRDRPLCDTLRIRSFEENGIIDALKTLQEDQTIFRMRYLGEVEFGATVKNLSSEVGVSRSIFSNFPLQVKHDTVYERNETLEQLERIKDRTTANAHMLTTTIVSMLDQLSGTWESIEPHYNIVQEWSNKYWIVGWATAMIIIWVLILMLMAFCCFLCNANVKAGGVMVITILVICISSFVIMLFGILTLAIGGNSEIFLCRPLFDDIEYGMLGKLFDKPGYFYPKEPQTGIIGELLRPPGENKSIVNVTLPRALRSCEQNRASYSVFQLDAFVNTTKIADLKQFPKVNVAIDSIHVSERTMLSLTQTIQNILENMLQTSNFNLTSFRASISTPTPEKDLATFIDQMQRVALQIQDVATSSRMTTLGSRAKRLQASILQPLEQLQNEIMYHLTALELQRDPWAKQVNQTLNHLRNIQGYLEKTAEEICRNQTTIYTKRLKDYLSASKAIMSSQLGDKTAMCRPFFDIFDANRIFICRNAVDYLNALWFFTFVSLFLWSIGTPMALNIFTIYGKLQEIQRAKSQESRSRRRERDEQRTSRERDEQRPSRERGGQRPSRERSEQRQSRERSRERSRDRDRDTTRESNRNRPQRQLRRSNTVETTDSISPNWGTSNASNAAAAAVARRTPPRTAPPPPPVPVMSRYEQDSVRSVRWEAQEDMVFEDVDSPNPMYMTRDNLI